VGKILKAKEKKKAGHEFKRKKKKEDGYRKNIN
jgi:hypothetical protein